MQKNQIFIKESFPLPWSKKLPNVYSMGFLKYYKLENILYLFFFPLNYSIYCNYLIPVPLLRTGFGRCLFSTQISEIKKSYIKLDFKDPELATDTMTGQDPEVYSFGRICIVYMLKRWAKSDILVTRIFSLSPSHFPALLKNHSYDQSRPTDSEQKCRMTLMS